MDRTPGLSYLRLWIIGCWLTGSADSVFAGGKHIAISDASEQAPHCAMTADERGEPKQIDPTCDVKVYYPSAADIGVALAVVPDQLVPRYKRIYDLSIQAIELGMLKDGYVLDRYYFPWSRKADALSVTGAPDRAADPTQTADHPKAEQPPNSSHQSASQTYDPRKDTFGIMTFRCDGWRGDQCGYPGTPVSAGTTVRAVYVVTDIETRGVARRSFSCE
jgi:hypothetical protein